CLAPQHAGCRFRPVKYGRFGQAFGRRSGLPQRTLLGGLMVLLRRFWRNNHGVSAIEFALILPFMAAFLMGGVQVTNALEANRKMSLAASTAADLTAQEQTLSTARRDDIFSAVDAILAPFDPSSLTVVITSLVFNNNQAVVAWSEGHRKQPRAVNDVV